MGKEMFRNLIQRSRDMPSGSAQDFVPGKHQPSSYVVCDVSEQNVQSFLGIMKELGVQSGNGPGQIRVAKGGWRASMWGVTRSR